jgi:xanthosine utilization system XapX-like protein
MEDRTFERAGALAAAAAAALSLLYALAYLVVTPAAQRASNVDNLYRSYQAHPTGARMASTCLALSGLLVGVAVVALARRLSARAPAAMSWASILGVVAGFGTAAHGLVALLGENELARKYATGDAATRAAVAVAHASPSQVDPRGLATFCAAGLAVLVLGAALRGHERRLGLLGMVLGLDMVALFLATATGVGPLVLLTGGLASVVLGPIWWISVARMLSRPASAHPAHPAPPAPPAPPEPQVAGT